MAALEAARALALPDWYLAAGFVRNLIWDHLHGKTQPTPLNDVDCVFWAPGVGPEQELELEQALGRKLSTRWEVRNQARMHVRSGLPPFTSTAHAIAHWVEQPTCVGVRLDPSGELHFTAAFGLRACWSLEVRPNPSLPHSEALTRERARAKRWKELWPRLRLAP